MSKEERELNRRLRILKHARDTGNVALTCRYFGIGRSTFYLWKSRFDKEGISGLQRRKPVGQRWPNQLSEEVVEKILHLRKKYHLGPERIMWYLERYHGIKVSCSSVYRTLVRNGVGRLPRNSGRRKSGRTYGPIGPVTPSSPPRPTRSPGGRCRCRTALPCLRRQVHSR